MECNIPLRNKIHHIKQLFCLYPSIWSFHLSIYMSFCLSVCLYSIQWYLSLADRTAVLAASLYGLVVPGSTSLSLFHPSCHATGAQPVPLVPTDSFPLLLSSKPSHTPLSHSACLHTHIWKAQRNWACSVYLYWMFKGFFLACSSSLFSLFLFHEDPYRLMPSLVQTCYNMHLPQEGKADFPDCTGLILWLCGDLVLLLNLVQQGESGKENRAGEVIF